MKWAAKKRRKKERYLKRMHRPHKSKGHMRPQKSRNRITDDVDLTRQISTKKSPTLAEDAASASKLHGKEKKE